MLPICSRALPCTLRAAAVARRLLPPDPYTAPRTACPSFDSRQYASAFNQPLSFDTSSVTNMYVMFYVRSSPRALPHNLQPRPPLQELCALRSSTACCPPIRIPRPAPRALLTLGRARRRSTSC